jgi:hypothetical protein
MKQEESKGPERARAFQKHFEQIDQLREMYKQQKGSITEKDLTLEVAAQDWPHLVNQNHKRYLKKRERAKELANTLASKQKEYIFREQEYRRTIEEIKRDIDQRSKKPLEQIKEPTEDEI